MDSQERHELKENDLAEFFQNFGEWWSRWGNTVLIIFVIVAGSFAAYRLVNYRTETRHETAWTELANAATAANYMEVAAAHQDPAVQALAYLRGADLYLAHARRPEDAPPLPARSEELPPPVDPEMAPDDAADRAERAYERVLELAEERTYHVNALLGLAAVAETRQAWDDARGYYDQAEELAGEQLPGLAATARQRRDLLVNLRQPVVFAPERARAPLPAIDEFDLGDLMDWDRPAPLSPAEGADEAEPGEEPAQAQEVDLEQLLAPEPEADGDAEPDAGEAEPAEAADEQ